MPPPNRQQARSHHARQAAIAAAGATAVGALFRRGAGWPDILRTFAAYQLASATCAVQTMAEVAERPPLVKPRAFAGATSAGFPLSEPLVAALDRIVPAPAEALPAPWWTDVQAEVEGLFDAALRVIEGEVKDAGREAFQAELVAGPEWTNYVRVLVPPSCKRCVILAGRIYRDLEGFSRHEPTCDCEHWPVTSWEEAHDAGLVSSPMEAFEKGYIRDLSQADAQAIRDGADITTVVNAAQGMKTVDLFGQRRVKATTYGTTKRSAWRKANPSRLVRLRPAAIYRFATDSEDAARLLKLYGYTT